MTFYTGTATDRLDLLAKVRDHAVAESWTVTRDTIAGGDGAELVLEIPGGGFIGMQDVPKSAVDLYILRFQGYTAYDTGVGFQAQTTRIPHSANHGPGISVRNCSMSYWVSINPRRMMLVVKIGNVYESAYLGRILSSAPAADYPNPMFIGGTLDSNVSGNTTLDNHWSSLHTTHESSIFNGARAGWVLQPDDTWDYTQYNNTRAQPHIWPTDGGLEKIGLNFDGTAPLFPVMIVSGPDSAYSFDAGSWLGYLEGVFATTSEKMSPEDTITKGTDTYTVFINVFNGEFGNHFALLNG